jgi:hypothetical protein
VTVVPDAVPAGTRPGLRAELALVTRLRARVRIELLLATELAALTGFVFARPVLGSFGASPETFIARGSDGFTVVAFGVAVVLLPLLAVAAVAALAGLVAVRVRLVVQLAAVGVLAGIAALQVLRSQTGLPDVPVKVLAAVAGAAMAAARWRTASAARFLRYAGVVSLVFLVQFLFLSPASSLVLGGRSASVDAETTAAIDEALGDDAPPVVVVVFDALPTSSLLDGDDNIDAELYPNLAALAADGTWYRNHTTVAPETTSALPAILSGRAPDGDATPPVASNHPRNLFTLLGGAYDVHAGEQVTALCPGSLCPQATDDGDGLVRLLRDARVLWSANLAARGDVSAGLPGAFGSRRADFAAWIEAQDFSSDDRPGLHFYHVLLPHDPFNWLPGGVRYQASQPPQGLGFGTWGQFGAIVGAQRHVLQTQDTDQLLGRLFERMRQAGSYDDALIVVTADHGAAFVPEAPVRGLARSQFEHIMWTPLIVKAPGQSTGEETEETGEVNDDNVQNVDILPIIADALGVDLADDVGWDVDGIVPGEAPPREPGDKAILDWDISEWRPPEGEDFVVVDGEEGFERVLGTDLVEGTGPLATWRRTDYGGLLGRPVGDVEQAAPVDVRLDVEHLDRFHRTDLASTLPIEVLGFAWIDAGEAVALAIDDQIAAVTTAEPTPFGIAAVHALLHPDALTDGDGVELTAYLVDGPPDDPMLRPLDVVGKQG